MNKKDEFKKFVKKNPNLIEYVKNGNTTWQKLFEIYDLYGEDNNIWKEYSSKKESNLDWINNINLDAIQNGISNIQKVLEMVKEITKKEEKKDEYKPRPIYKHFED